MIAQPGRSVTPARVAPGVDATASSLQLVESQFGGARTPGMPTVTPYVAQASSITCSQPDIVDVPVEVVPRSRPAIAAPQAAPGAVTVKRANSFTSTASPGPRGVAEAKDQLVTRHPSLVPPTVAGFQTSGTGSLVMSSTGYSPVDAAKSAAVTVSTTPTRPARSSQAQRMQFTPPQVSVGGASTPATAPMASWQQLQPQAMQLPQQPVQRRAQIALPSSAPQQRPLAGPAVQPQMQFGMQQQVQGPLQGASTLPQPKFFGVSPMTGRR